MEAIEVLQERWERESTRAVLEELASGETHARTAWAVSFLTGHMRTVSRRSGQSGQIVLPRWAMEKLDVKIGDFVVLDLTDHGTLELRRVTEAELSELVRAAVERAGRLLPAGQPERELKYSDKRCEQCGEPYCARRAYQRFCPSCGRLRRAAAKRAYERSRAAERTGASQASAEKTVVLTGASA
jgi:antitoxin component of MazEF toxin-antitoxin module